MTPSKKIAELGLALPMVPPPVGSYTPAVRSGKMIYTSGQIPTREGKLIFTGKVPMDVPLADASHCAAVAALNGLAAIGNLVGGIDAIVRIVRVCVYVNSSPKFTAQPTVANGASDLLVQVFGDAGRHARSAVGVSELPLNAPVEVELVAEVD